MSDSQYSGTMWEMYWTGHPRLQHCHAQTIARHNQAPFYKPRVHYRYPANAQLRFISSDPSKAEVLPLLSTLNAVDVVWFFSYNSKTGEAIAQFTEERFANDVRDSMKNSLAPTQHPSVQLAPNVLHVRGTEVQELERFDPQKILNLFLVFGPCRITKHIPGFHFSVTFTDPDPALAEEDAAACLYELQQWMCDDWALVMSLAPPNYAVPAPPQL